MGVTLTHPSSSSLIGSGDAQEMYTATTPQKLRVRSGTSAAPDSSLNPLVKVERTISIADTAVAGDGGEQCAAILGIGVGTSTCEVQPVGVYGAAKNSSAAAGSAAPQPDACGLYGAGRVTGSGIGSGIGAFVIGRRDNDTGRACGLEVHVANYGTVAGTYSPTGASNLKGIWLNCSGDAASGVGIQLQNAFGRQFEVGIGFGSQVTGGFTGPVSGQSIRDDSNSTTSIQINGTHTQSIGVAAGAGPVFIGKTSGATYAPSLFEVYKSAASDPIGAFVSDGQLSVRVATGSGSGSWFGAAAANNMLTGTVAGDTGMKPNTSGKFFHIGGTTSVIKVGIDNTLGFFNVTSVSQRTGWGAPTGGGPTRTTFDTTTVTLPQLAERVRGLIDDLKALGLMGA